MTIREAPFIVDVRSLHQAFEDLDSFVLLEFFVLERINPGTMKQPCQGGTYDILFQPLLLLFRRLSLRR